MPSFRNKVRIEGCEVIKQTPKAILVDIDGVQHWIPQSQVDDDSEIWEEGDRGTLVISDWIADEKGLGR